MQQLMSLISLIISTLISFEVLIFSLGVVKIKVYVFPLFYLSSYLFIEIHVYPTNYYYSRERILY